MRYLISNIVGAIKTFIGFISKFILWLIFFLAPKDKPRKYDELGEEIPQERCIEYPTFFCYKGQYIECEKCPINKRKK